VLLALTVGVLIGLAFGALDVVTLAIIESVNVLVWRTDVDAIDTVWAMLAYGSSRITIEPFIKNRVMT
jgi:hypothetical protein